MNAPLRKVAVAVLVLFAALFVNLNYVQVVEANKLRTNPANKRLLLQTYERQRGAIVVAGRFVAASRATNDKLKYLRTYPGGAEYAHVTGFYSLVYGSTGIEHNEDSFLSGEDDRLFVRRLGDIVNGRTPRGGNVVLTINPTAQAMATKALGTRRGAVVALDPRTGAILAMVSNPTYDPNLLSSHDTVKIRAAWTNYRAAPGKPLLNRAISESYPPGSTFKVIVAAAALRAGYQPDTVIPAPHTYTPPGTTKVLANFDNSVCSGTNKQKLIDALTISCNTAFAGLGVALGAEKVQAQAQAFGVGDDTLRVPMRVAASQLGSLADKALLAQSSIGQHDVRFTPLQDAMIAAAVANGGKLMKPYLVDELRAPDLTVLGKAQPSVYRDALPADIAGELATMMRSVVENGTGKNARIPGYVVAGKTGTAQNAGPDHGWFIGFAGKPGDTPPVAIAVVLENAGRGGSGDATQIAGTVMQAVLGSTGGK